MALQLLIVLLNLYLSNFAVEGREILKAKDMKVKGVEPMITDEFDCIDFYKQSAFSHPSLKDHEVQSKPSFLANLKKNKELSSIDVESEYLGCPLGKVPIQKRIDKENDNFHRLTKTYPGQHFAVVRNSLNLTAHGIRGKINTRDLQIQYFQVSAAQLWIQNGPQSQLNSIQAGWEINPILYGDSYTRVTAFWTTDNFDKSGCYNSRCPGFVQVHPQYFLGQRCPTSESNAIDIMINQDKASGNWWLIAEGDIAIGYWPKQLFNYLSNGATFIQYGGWTVNIPNSTSPPMGNGEFASTDIEGFGTTAYISRMKLVNGGYSEASPNFIIMETYSDDSECYTVYYNGYAIRALQHAMSYGGPGGSCSN